MLAIIAPNPTKIALLEEAGFLRADRRRYPRGDQHSRTFF